MRIHSNEINRNTQGELPMFKKTVFVVAFILALMVGAGIGNAAAQDNPCNEEDQS